MEQKEKDTFSEQEYENFRAYHSLQYDRMDKLESRREIFNSIVLSASLAVITFGFSKESNLNIYSGAGLLLILILANCAAILFSKRSLEFFNMHQKRAAMARSIYAPQFNVINEKVGKRDSTKDKFNRTNLYIYLHILTILVVITAFFSNLYISESQKIEVEKCCKCSKQLKPIGTTNPKLDSSKLEVKLKAKSDSVK